MSDEACPITVALVALDMQLIVVDTLRKKYCQPPKAVHALVCPKKIIRIMESYGV